MLKILNIARLHGIVLSVALTGSIFVGSGCERVPLLAPTGSTMTLTASATALSLNTTAVLTAQVIEASGQPPHSGTHIVFTTSLGSIQPPEADTDINGRAVVTFNAGYANGTAVITASSGAASASGNNAVKIAVGTAAVGRVVVSANPTLIAAAGGTSTISAAVSDINGNALANAPVAFSTTAGTITPTIGTTDATGIATSRLQTTITATVTASVGAQGGSSTGGGGGTGGGGTGGGGTAGGTTPPTTGQASGSVTVNVAASPTLVITPPTTPPSAGLPASFTFAVTIPATNGSAIRDLTVNWGDGTVPQDLGVVSSTSIQSHVYRAQGNYVISATLIDTIGNTVTQQAAVSVIPVPRPGIVITPSPVPGHVNTLTTFTITITLPAGIGAQDVSINFGDGATQDLGGSISVAVSHTYVITGTFTVTVTVLDTTGQSTPGTTQVSIGL